MEDDEGKSASRWEGLQHSGQRLSVHYVCPWDEILVSFHFGKVSIPKPGSMTKSSVPVPQVAIY
jgi:hypothetical protein